MIWSAEYKLEDVNEVNLNMSAYLGIRFTEILPDRLIGTMPVDHRTQQPMGLLHGGASVVLAETLGSVASNLILDRKRQYAVGQSIYAHHLRSVTSGIVRGIATPIHIGKNSHVWNIDVVDDEDRIVCTTRLSTAILNRQPENG